MSLARIATLHNALKAATQDSDQDVADEASRALRKLNLTSQQEQTALTNIASGTKREKIDAIHDIVQLLKRMKGVDFG